MTGNSDEIQSGKNLTFICLLPRLKASSERDFLHKKNSDEKSCTNKAECNFSPKENSDKPSTKRKIFDWCLC